MLEELTEVIESESDIDSNKKLEYNRSFLSTKEVQSDGESNDLSFTSNHSPTSQSIQNKDSPERANPNTSLSTQPPKNASKSLKKKLKKKQKKQGNPTLSANKSIPSTQLNSPNPRSLKSPHNNPNLTTNTHTEDPSTLSEESKDSKPQKALEEQKDTSHTPAIPALSPGTAGGGKEQKELKEQHTTETLKVNKKNLKITNSLPQLNPIPVSIQQSSNQRIIIIKNELTAKYLNKKITMLITKEANLQFHHDMINIQILQLVNQDKEVQDGGDKLGKDGGEEVKEKEKESENTGASLLKTEKSEKKIKGGEEVKKKSVFKGKGDKEGVDLRAENTGKRESGKPVRSMRSTQKSAKNLKREEIKEKSQKELKKERISKLEALVNELYQTENQNLKNSQPKFVRSFVF